VEEAVNDKNYDGWQAGCVIIILVMLLMLVCSGVSAFFLGRITGGW
jgi:hypothetical protein